MSDPTFDLVRTALDQTHLAGLSTMLEILGKVVGADGCILWELAPGASLDGEPPLGQLFVLGQWFPSGMKVSMYDVSCNSRTTAAIRNQRTEITDSTVQDEPPRSFRGRSGLRNSLAVPIDLGQNVKGAITLYRQRNDPFNRDAIKLIERLAPLIPALYRTISDKVGRELLQKVDDLMHEADQSPPVSAEDAAVQTLMTKVCEQVSECFQCLEVSVFLTHHLQPEGICRRIGTTWPRPGMQTDYLPREGQGLTGWVLKNGKPMRIFDLAHFDRDKPIIQNDYPDLEWTSAPQIKESAIQWLGLSNPMELPPLSFMAAPILRGNQILGVIRCSIVKEVPYYFSGREWKTLQMVAAQIGRWWTNCLSRWQIEEENKALRVLVRGLADLNRFVQEELDKPRPNEQAILGKALDALQQTVPDGEIMDVRLVDEASHDLYFAATSGEAWERGTQKENADRRQRRFPIDGNSAGALVIRTGKTYLIPDVSVDKYYSGTFPITKKMIVAPIGLEGKPILGVLDIRGIGDRPFPEYALIVAELLGQQLGLYRVLVQAEAEVVHSSKKQIQVFKDLKHQLKSPILQAHRRIQPLPSTPGIHDDLQKQLLAIRGLLGKAKRVAAMTGTFVDLANERRIRANRAPLSVQSLLKLLYEMANDNEVMVADRNIRFSVDRQSFSSFQDAGLQTDQDLLEQAVNELLNNAGKYSYENTVVRIQGGRKSREKCFIAVTNRGLTIRGDEVHLCKRRGWRSDAAELTTGEGSGTGLWVVDHIMRDQGGDLEILASEDGQTTIRLILPEPPNEKV